MGTLRTYITGFILSVLFTLTAFYLVMNNVLSTGMLLPTIVVLAMVQLLVQMVFFLHLAKEKNPRWNLLVFVSTISVILIIVIGSLWIMQHLNYNMMPLDMNSYILQKNAGF